MTEDETGDQFGEILANLMGKMSGEPNPGPRPGELHPDVESGIKAFAQFYLSAVKHGLPAEIAGKMVLQMFASGLAQQR